MNDGTGSLIPRPGAKSGPGLVDWADGARWGLYCFAQRGRLTSLDALDDRRRRLPTGEPYPRGVVVCLPLPAGSRALEAERPARDSSGDRLTPIDYIAMILLFLSTLTGPVLVWALVSF